MCWVRMPLGGQARGLQGPLVLWFRQRRPTPAALHRRFRAPRWCVWRGGGGCYTRRGRQRRWKLQQRACCYCWFQSLHGHSLLLLLYVHISLSAQQRILPASESELLPRLGGWFQRLHGCTLLSLRRSPECRTHVVEIRSFCAPEKPNPFCGSPAQRKHDASSLRNFKIPKQRSKGFHTVTLSATFAVLSSCTPLNESSGTREAADWHPQHTAWSWHGAMIWCPPCAVGRGGQALKPWGLGACCLRLAPSGCHAPFAQPL